MSKPLTKTQELEEFLQISVTVNVLAHICKVPERTVNEYRDKGIIKRDADGRYHLAESLAGLISHYKTTRGRGRPPNDESDKNPLTAEQVRKIKAQADTAEFNLAIKRGEFIPREDVVAGARVVNANARARLLAIPSKAAPQIVGESNPIKIQEVLREFVEEACHELSDTKFHALIADAQHDGGGDDSGGEDMDSSA